MKHPYDFDGDGVLSDTEMLFMENNSCWIAGVTYYRNSKMEIWADGNPDPNEVRAFEKDGYKFIYKT